ncbi:MAG TPA: ABC transporter permease [Acidimicrobiales bacterium]|nr:ABC transporter permease [Acidimicrobiales bacterium]
MTTVNPTVETPIRTLDLPRPTHAAGALTTTLGVARRTVLRNVRNPQVFILGMVQGAMFLLIFRYVFGGAITTNGVRYVDFLVPGFVGTGVLFSGMTASIGAAGDLEEGFFDRLRSLPVPRVAIAAGRVLADTVLATIGLTVTTLVGFAMGFRTSAPLGGLLLAVALCVFAAFAFTWLFVLLGLIAGNPQAAQSLGLLVFPFTFVSSAFVPVESMPGWMQAFARNQPLTQIVSAVRAFTLGDDAQRVLGHSAGYFATRSLVWCALFIVVFAPLAARRYQRG